MSIYSTKGVVLYHLKYSETSVIAHIYTEMFGRQSYILKGVRRRKSKISMGLLQPLSILDMQVYNKPKSTLNNVKEITGAIPLQSIHFEPIKSTIAFFIAEVLHRTLHEEDNNQPLFDFITNAIQLFDLMDTQSPSTTNFHLLFLFYLSKFLGFTPQSNFSDSSKIFDLLNGIYRTVPPAHAHYLSMDESELFCWLYDKKNNFSFNNAALNERLTRKSRSRLLDILLEYYKLHIEGMGKIKSLDILRQL